MFSAQIEEVSDMPLLNVIEKLGGWPVTDPNWDETKAIDLETLVAVIKRNFTLGVLIEEWVGPDDRNSEKHIIQVSFVHCFILTRKSFKSWFDHKRVNWWALHLALMLIQFVPEKLIGFDSEMMFYQ